jgi:hypothetical protein
VSTEAHDAEIRHAARPGWYWWLTIAILPVLLSVLSVYASVRFAERARLDGDRQDCALIAAILQAYRETPPTTPTGQSVAQAYESQYQQLRCPTPP